MNNLLDVLLIAAATLAIFWVLRKEIQSKKRRARTAEVEETFKLLVGAVKDYAIYMLDTQGMVKTWNEGAERIKGYRAEEIIGQHYSKFYPPESIQQGEPEKLLHQAIRDGHVETESIRIRKDGTRFFADVVITALYDHAGTLRGFAKVTRDITERRKAAEALHRKEEELFQSQKIEAIGRLAGGIAHDFNNLMAGIRGLTENIVAEGGTVENHEADLLEIVDATQRATDLTRQLLVFGRKQIVRPVVLNLNIVIRNLERMVQQLLGESIVLKLSLDPNLGNVRIDASQIEQVLINLLLNARDAMPRGGQISIETVNVDSAASYVCLSVTDTGAGMSPEIQRHIFEPFFTTKGKEMGTGLGLATAHGIMRQHRGNITFESTPGKGTTFRLYIPRVADPLPIDKSPAKFAAAKGKETILLVEDEDIVRQAASQALRRAGFQVLEARGGSDALAVSAGYKKRIDLLLTDVIMPIMNGRALAEYLITKRTNLKVLYMSGFTEGVIVDRGILDPGIAFIEKTFTNDGLVRHVRRVLDSPTPITVTH